MNKIGSGSRNDALPAAGRCSHLSAPKLINGARNVDIEPARRQRRALREIAENNDFHLLKDIGVSQEEAFREAEKPFWRR